MKNYPKKPHFTINEDNHGRKYFTAYSNITSKAVMSMTGKKLTVTGNPKIWVRVGYSKYGEEMGFELLRDRRIKPTLEPCNSDYETVEIYLPKEIGIKFLEEALKFLKKNHHHSSTGNLTSPSVSSTPTSCGTP
ncbi:MAG: hypothetical protein JSW08_03075 [archaeon]|nr:MAG: hypothetical protein JSW08_03075 [archaeon]